MKLAFYISATLLWLAALTSDFGMPKLGPFLNYSSGILQIKSPEMANSESHIESNEFSGKIYIDSIGIPHIFAKDDESSLFMLGYMHARDRLFQMDLITRMMQAELSELVGNVALPSDEYWINFQFKRRAKAFLADIEKNDPSQFALLQAYSSGVNKYIAGMSVSELPEEYHLMGVRPRDWQAENPFYLIKYMARMLSHRKTDLHLQEVFNSLPKSLVDKFYPLQEPYLETIIPEKGDTTKNLVQREFTQNKTATYELSNSEQEQVKEMSVYGSNSWAVAGKKSASGEAILSNDMHLALTLPGPWYEVHIKTPKKHYYGLSIPAAPVVVAGFTEAISWGITNAQWDLADYSKVDYIDSTKIRYGNSIEPIRFTKSEIKLKDGSSKELIVREISRGPIIKIQNVDYLVDWTGTETGAEFRAFTSLQTASTWQEFLTSLENFYAPPQNILFADTAGNIGLITNGKMPLKNAKRLQGVYATSDSLASFRGYIPYNELPQIYKPEKGFIASANQRQIYNATHYYTGSSIAPPYRGKAISDRLRKLNKASPEQVANIQASIVDLSAKDLLAILIRILESEPRYQKAKAFLESWDFQMKKELVAPTIYDAFRQELFALVNEDILKNTSIITPPDYVIISILKSQEQIEGVSRSELFKKAFERSLDLLSEKFGEEISEWTYGKYHRTSIKHLLKLAAFSEAEFASDGSKYTANVARGPNVTAGSSQRYLIHMTSPVQAWMNIAGGQSGRPSSPNFKNQIPLWKKVGLRKVEFVKSASELKKTFQTIKFGASNEN